MKREGSGSRVSVCAEPCSRQVGCILVAMKDFFIEDAARFDNATVTTYFVLTSMQVREKKQGGAVSGADGERQDGIARG